VYPDLAVIVFLYPESAAAGISVWTLIPELDLAVLRAGSEAARAKPIVFAGRGLLPPGRPVAGLGFPTPDRPVMHTTGGQLTVSRRLATGYISGEVTARFEDAPWTAEDLPHYEVNMLSYPGLSGSPLLDVEGRVVGVNRGIRRHGQQIAAYSFSLRNQEVCRLLEERGMPFSENLL